MSELDIRKEIIEMCLQMNSTGLNQGTSGNISARYEDQMLITPSGIPYDNLVPEDIASVKLDSEALEWSGPYNPSSEWRFHKSVLNSKPQMNAVVHTHSTFATIVSIAREAIPACHYMIAAFGGNTVPCADYKTFGSGELSDTINEALKDRTACLMANHGMIVSGTDLSNAMWAAIELETLAKQYYYAKLAGNMTILSEQEMDEVLEKFKSYGQKKK